MSHRKLTSGDDGPLPCGFEKGDGNISRRRPAVRCGIALHKKAPAKKIATKLMVHPFEEA
jgi:hypothetical protein